MCSIMGAGPGLGTSEFMAGFSRTVSRGPDMTRVEPIDLGDGKTALLGFHRLAIMGLSKEADRQRLYLSQRVGL